MNSEKFTGQKLIWFPCSAWEPLLGEVGAKMVIFCLLIYAFPRGAWERDKNRFTYFSLFINLSFYCLL
jgi:hypothetical protein